MAGLLADLTLRLGLKNSEFNKNVGKSSQQLKKMKKHTNYLKKDVSNFTKTSVAGMGQLASGVGGTAGVIQQQFQNVGRMGKNLKGMFMSTGSAWKKVDLIFKASVVGTIIAAIVVAVKGLMSYFKGTVRGAEDFNKISSAVSATLGTLKDVIISVGEWLVNAFKNPKQAISELWDKIKTNLMNKLKGAVTVFKGVAKVLKGVLTLNKDTINAGVEEFKDGWAKAYEQERNFIKKVGKEMKKDQKDSLELAERENKLWRRREEFKIKGQKLENQISNHRMKANDASLSESERLKHQNLAIEKQKQLSNERYAIAKEEYEIKKGENALNESSKEDIEKENDLRVAMMNIEKQRDDKLKRMLSRQGTLTRKAEKERKEKKKQKEIEEKINNQLKQRLSLKDFKLEFDKTDIDKTANSLADVGYTLDDTKEKEKEWKEENETSTSSMQEAWNNSMQGITNIVSNFSDIFTNKKDSEINKVEERAKKEGKSEEWLKKEKESINKKYAKKEKSMSIAQAVINTLQGMTKALSAAPPPLNFALAASTAAMGYAQVDSIKSQPIGFKDGGIVAGRTIAEVGEYAGVKNNPEVISPLRDLQKMITPNTMGNVRFEIEGDNLIGVLDNANIKNNSY